MEIQEIRWREETIPRKEKYEGVGHRTVALLPDKRRMDYNLSSLVHCFSFSLGVNCLSDPFIRALAAGVSLSYYNLILSFSLPASAPLLLRYEFRVFCINELTSGNRKKEHKTNDFSQLQLPEILIV